MSGILGEIRAFKARKAVLETEARQLVALRLISGVDMAAPAGSPIVATMDGVVGKAGWAGGYGWRIDVLHEGGVQTRYAHLSRFNVSEGQAVKQGDVIGFVGSTGDSTGPHLHYEVRVNGIAVNPLAS